MLVTASSSLSSWLEPLRRRHAGDYGIGEEQGCGGESGDGGLGLKDRNDKPERGGVNGSR
jgi:hypothetical protein